MQPKANPFRASDRILIPRTTIISSMRKEALGHHNLRTCWYKWNYKRAVWITIEHARDASVIMPYYFNLQDRQVLANNADTVDYFKLLDYQKNLQIKQRTLVNQHKYAAATQIDIQLVQLDQQLREFCIQTEEPKITWHNHKNLFNEAFVDASIIALNEELVMFNALSL